MHNQRSKTLSAAQRWQASGHQQPAPLRDRLAMLSELTRLNLTATEIRLCNYLILDRINADTGLCYASEQNMAENLGLTDRAIRKAKQSLKAKGILEWHTERTNGQNQICLYRFTYKVRRNERSVDQRNERSASIRNDHSASIRNDRSVPTEPIYISLDSQEAAAWRLHGARIPHSSRSGRWQVTTRWPPGHPEHAH